MHWDQMAGKWSQVKGTVKQRWGKLTDADLTAISGKRDELVGKIQERYGITKEKAEPEGNQWKMPSEGVHEIPREKAG